MNIAVEEVTTSKELENVYKLTYETFRERRLCTPRLDRKLCNNMELDFHPGTRIFVAKLGEEVIGTLSYTVCETPQSLYNYQTFAADLDQEVLPNGRAFSSWRMATKSGFMIQPLVLLMLIRKVIEVNLSEKTTRGYFSVISEDMHLYKKTLHNTSLVATRRKKTSQIDGELAYFRIDVDQSHVDMLSRRIDIMSRRMESKSRKAAG